MSQNISAALLQAGQKLRAEVDRLAFAAPVAHVYNPLEYAWAPYEQYLRRYGATRKRVVFLGMNPGPFGMVQTGVPFGEISAVRDWLGVEAPVQTPAQQHPKRPVEGFLCKRCEISGQRLWGLFAARFEQPDAFFREHFVLNYCPLAFMEDTGRNRTPDKLPVSEREALFAACDRHLRRAVEALGPEWVVAVGDFAFKRAQEAFGKSELKLGRILHPSPASPAANRDWSGLAARQLKALAVW